MKKNAVVFGGQGAQYIGMGKEIYDSFSVARDVFNLASHTVGYDIAKVCFEGTQTELNNIVNCQLCTLSIELALLEVFKTTGVPIHAVAGFSLGEYAALVAATVVDLPTVFDLVYNRSKTIEKEALDNIGIMAAVLKLGLQEVQDICTRFESDKLAITNFNAYNQVTVFLTQNTYEAFNLCVKSKGGIVIPLPVNCPYHHSMMLPAANKFKQYLDTVNFKAPQISIYMNYSGRKFSVKKDCFSEILYKQLIKPVQWIGTIENMLLDEVEYVYEISPKSTLKAFISNISKGKISTCDVKELLSKKEFLGKQ